jgi:hypothetical protein
MTPQDQGNGHSIWFHYRFTSPQGRVREFHVDLDPDTLGLVVKEREDYPEWTRLTHHQCTNCPLRPEDHPRCPVAANLVEVIEHFRDAVSCEETQVEIATESRTYRKQAPLQDGLSSLVGIYMVASGCPILDKLRPMVRSHLPFATSEETTYRAVAMYWLIQFFRKQRGLEPDWELEGLVRIYEEIITVNGSFRVRIADVLLADAGLNALFRLDCYAQITNRLLLRKNLGEIERIFYVYLKD